MKMENGRYVIFGNTLSKSDSRKATKWQEMFVKKFKYDLAAEGLSLWQN